MSIYDELLHRVNQRRLFELNPRMPGTFAKRRMFVSRSINNLCKNWDDERFESLRADLDRFMQGGMISVRLPPSKDVEAYLALLEPETDAVWEIRSIAPEPQIRFFGLFAQTDTFVALEWAYRHALDEVKFGEAMASCKHEWGNLFPAYQPLSEAKVHVSAKFFLV